MGWARTRQWTLCAAVGALAMLSGCNQQEATALAQSETARPVAVEKVARRDLDRSLELAAEFRPYQEVELFAKVPGYLKAIYVDVGDVVTQGQLIAELEAPEMTQELAQGEANLKRAQADIVRTRSEVKRAESQEAIRRVSYDRLAGVLKARPNLVAQQEIDDAQARLQDAEAQLSTSKAVLSASEEQASIVTAGNERLQTMLTYLRITAPFSGMITKRLADPGAMIQAGTASHVQAMPIVELSQVDRLRLILPVPESIVAQIRTNSPVEVRVDSLRRVVQGRITRFTGKLDSSTRTMETEVDLPNPGGLIKPGMFGYATLSLERHLNALSVPVQALSARTSPVPVLVVNSEKRLEERQINLGMETPDRVEVLSGLKEDELVVVGARANLRKGLLVEPKLQAPSTEGAAH